MTLATACGADATGGTPVGNGVIDVAPDQTASAGCATFVDGKWGTGSTSFDSTTTEPKNAQCALIPVVEESTTFWITSSPFEGSLNTNQLRHSFSTAEAAVEAGSAKFELTGPNSEPLFSGTLVVRKATASSVDYSVEK